MTTRSPSQIAMRRIQSELSDWLLDERRPEGCHLESFEPLLSWIVVIDGPDVAPGMPNLYAGERFRLRVNFSDRYPLDPPEVFFIPPSPVHPHIYSNGHICLDILYDGDNGGWSPALTLGKVAISLRSMLASNSERKRPPGDQEYCARTCGRSPKQTRWEFEDDTV
ncbi:UBC-like protein [Coccomyxa subellipsoidea C-169]|uniref:UBC-like protein n=1 Tax=Coccomyxa subellipsoidea (strain C-169) TaxID=574566 RepID=I0YS81_COCSC|nr:UBC-like protein [Coccomyxa subellipsoidea C-169]EIE21250.1 UBC-like protein [Coccomyxa subellipsoidea C-169]|eukprot:XP_005645794.1 UBC-like protein [Coccomyxa subellipsoidea C-169]